MDSFYLTDQLPAGGNNRLPFLPVLGDTALVKSSQLCFVLESEGNNADRLGDFFPDSQLEWGLELMFSIESLGLLEKEGVSDYDKEKVRQCQESIVLRDTKYYVWLPWHTEKLAQVPSYYTVSLCILDCVVQNLERRGIYQEYLEVFYQQEQMVIIEEIFVPPNRIKNYA